ncbi:MAG TPA: SDR family oxidoreductase [Symbiobacteriaceae bacterium]|jgi:hypothetical protein
MQGKGQQSKQGTVLVTGASAGLGYELAKQFGRNGWDLVLVARDRKRLEQVASEFGQAYGVTARVIAKDLSEPSSPAEIFAELRDKHIHVDILINNAGVGEYGPFLETDLQKELQTIQVNMSSLTHLTKLFLPAMLERKRGKVMNVAAIASVMPGPFTAVYFATKAYVLSFSEALSEELRGTGVTVTAFCPGVTRTEFARRSKMEGARIFALPAMEAADVAGRGYRALMRGKAVSVPGVLNKVMVLMMGLTPRNLVRRMAKLLLGKPAR